MGDFHKHWRISVESHGDLIVAIETECLAGRELSETDVATVNHAISHLNGFMGNPGTIAALEAENQRLREALKWFEKHRLDAIARAGTITAREDNDVKALCERYGYGAVIDSAARQWACKPDGKSGAFFVGGCIGDTTARAALEGE